MKKSFVFLTTLITVVNLSVSAQSDSISFEADSSIDSSLVHIPGVSFYDLEFAYSEFAEFAKMVDKPYFVDFYATWCAPCKLMDELVYSDPEIADHVNANLLAYKVNVEFFDGMDISETYNVKQYPTILFFNSDGKMVGRESGLYSADGFRGLLKKYFP
ncbi:MAG: thioredoxin fold domain-containing protein [Chitinophagales bacterium]|nr:thioredoxin fold domain-containing protein [Chitinophagales bacterium]